MMSIKQLCGKLHKKYKCPKSEKMKYEHIKHVWYIVSVVLLLLLFCFLLVRSFCIVSKVDDISTPDNRAAIITNCLIATLGFVAIVLSLQNDKQIKRFEYVEEYNFHFLTNKQFMDIERKLESCYQKYKEIAEKQEDKWNPIWKAGEGTEGSPQKEFEDYCDKIFGTSGCKFSDDTETGNGSKYAADGSISKDYQKLINYLVYLEAFVPLIIYKQVELEEVDNLFGYRYFVAMNNPVMQLNELIPEKAYYKSCHEVYADWRDFRGDNIPLKAYVLK